jgi:PRTRC genetic system ThiF family protein
MHALNPELLRRAVRVLVIGCGGSGSAIASGLPYLHQAMLVAGHAGGLHVTIMDGDLISPSNCVRQPFCSSEIGLSKAIVMISRLNLFWGLNWTAVAEHLTSQTDISNIDIVIGCVDTRAARHLIHTKVQYAQSRVAYWLDLGNSTDSGQFVLGQPLNGRNSRSATRLRTAPELFPEIADPSLDDDGIPSCSALEALERQEPFVNQVLAYHALGLLTQLFRYGRLEHHGAFVNVRESRVQPLCINSAIWKKLRRRGRRLMSRSAAQALVSKCS